MRTAGIDFAAEADNTALAVIEWGDGGDGGRAALTELDVGVDDDRCVEVIERVDKAGIDGPFGWPVPFVEFVTAVGGRSLTPPADGTGREWRRTLVYRATDIAAREHLGRFPLSVSADLIAHAAFRLAGVLTRLDRAGIDVDRTGRGRVVEAYPALALKVWGLPNAGYKRSSDRLVQLADRLVDIVPWLDVGQFRSLMSTSDHAFDAVVASLIARAVATGHTIWPTDDQQPLAEREGWIAVPTGGVDALVTGE